MIVVNGIYPAGSFISNYSVGWRGCWYVMLALNGFSALGLAAFYYPPKGSEMDESEIAKHGAKYKPLNFDWIGFFILGGSLVAFLIGPQWGGNQYAWDSGWVLSTLIIGIVGLFGFCAYEALVKPEVPLISTGLITKVRVYVVHSDRISCLASPLRSICVPLSSTLTTPIDSFSLVFSSRHRPWDTIQPIYFGLYSLRHSLPRIHGLRAIIK